ncbi:SagB family peptide dehydrogenase [Streptomyces sp. RKAG293]|uniref:SagB family peptide dehydrogenase n=1 Tax=Streptomyces sp. RKAG293 TaxID=2893403 RepID=UPI002033740C|nr:SagB family peptide dehydrogenase [Streptomyces sp. RKAG293]MCM2423109.1 SagB family peptide dehydrogenase [Streptomyces sp. RKAG293]
MTITEQPLTTADAELSRVRRMLTLRQDVKVAAEGDDVELTHPWGRQRVHALGAPTVQRLLALGAGPVDADALAGDREAGRLLSLLGRFPYLVTSILDDPLTGPLATAVPIARSAATPGAPDLGSTAVVLSRFAYLRRLPDGPADGGGGTIGQGCVMESPLAPYRVTLHQPAAAAFVAALTTPRTVAEAAALAGLPEQSGAALAALLAGTGFMEPAAGASVGAAPALPAADPPLWDFHDLLFHSRSRAGRHDYTSGGVFAHQDVPHPPALPGAGSNEDEPGIDLPVPDWDEVTARDPRLTEVLEGRRSIRTYAETPVTLEQIAELLYRAARVRQVIPRDPSSPNSYDAIDRPYPAGGATGELEIYLSVAACEGLPTGVYRYDAAAHRLQPRRWHGAADEAAFRELLTAAWRATNCTVDPQVLLTVTSRFGRLSWKYSQIAYALTLKHVGVLYQTLYLVATAMGLAPCGLGSGDTDAAARALGLDWTSESSVGEFLIGSRPASGSGSLPQGFCDIVDTMREQG